VSSATLPCRTAQNVSAASPSRKSTSPSPKRTFEAQPARSVSCSGSSPAKTGTSRRTASIVSIASLRGADRAELLGHVDRDRAPGDAAAAADAARRPELVVPGAELVRQPLPVARAARRPDAAAVDVRVVDREAGLPGADALRRLAGQV